MNEWRILSLLLQYPDPELLAARRELAAQAAALAASPQREAILVFLPYWLGADPLTLQRQYVATFDFNQRATLHLSFFAYGDRRQRGLAMLRLKQRYEAAGWPLQDGELPDHLAVLLEFAGLAGEPEGSAVLAEFRPALELVRAALHEQRSPYATLIDAVCLGLEPLSDEQVARVRELALRDRPGSWSGSNLLGRPR